MFDTLLIANRGDQPAPVGAAAQPNCLARAACAGDLVAGAVHV
ncbi:hypothetical protein [Hydrogenophaga pseudoflava]|nr:hypothetical protein [Hydrogenophaga pseudoflava]